MRETSEEVHMEKKKRASKVSKKLAHLFPDAKIALHYSSHLELLVSVILSAQCTDKKVNEVTLKLFNKYRSIEDYLRVHPEEFEEDIRSTGFYRNKTKNILLSTKIIKEKFGGKIPSTMNELLSLPGVARKTANIVLGNAFGKVEGIAVDTHVKRLSRKLDLTNSGNPIVIERDLMKLFPRREWFTLTLRLIEYGRTICPARKHVCENHPLSLIYPPAASRWP
jgi:endonuclease-3